MNLPTAVKNICQEAIFRLWNFRLFYFRGRDLYDAKWI